MTEGLIGKKLISFFFPIFLGNLSQQLYTTVDAIIVGRFIGKSALASIDAIYNLTKLPLSVFMGLSAAVAVLISQYYGAKDQDSLDKSVHTAAAFCVVGGLIMSGIGLLTAAPAIQRLNVPREILPETLSYVRIIFAGTVVTLIFSIGAGILRAVGDSKTPLIYITVCNCLNVALDLLLIGAFQWGVEGAAFATVLSQSASAALIVRHLTRTRLPCKLIFKRIRFHKYIIKRMFQIGLPLSLQNTLYPASNMVIQSSINAYGVDSIAAWALCGKLDLIIWVAAAAFGTIVSTFTAQNFGAKAYGRIKRGTNICLGLSVLVIGIISATLLIWCKSLGSMIINDQEVIDICTDIVRLIAPFYIIYTLGEVISGAMRGIGETFKPMLITLLGTCGLRVAWIALVPQSFSSLISVLMSYPVSWFTTTIVLFLYAQRVISKLHFESQ